MNFSRATLIAAVAAAGLAANSAQATDYFEIFTEATAAGSQTNPFLDSVATNGSRTAYAVSRTNVGNSGQVTKLVNGVFDSTVMTDAQWDALADVDLGGSFGTGLVGSDTLGIINFFDSTYYKVDLNTGTPSVFVSAIQFALAAGGPVNITSANEVLSDGSAYAYDATGDQVLFVDSLGNVSVEVTQTDLQSLAGSSTLSTPGFALVGSDLYFGSNVSDSLYKWDTVANAGSVVLNTAQLEALSDDIDGTAGIDDIFYAPDGLVYFYEDDADYIYSFDPADPVNSLAVVLTEDELIAGPAASDAVGELQWYKGALAWTRQGTGFYGLSTAIPAPTGVFAGMAMLGALSGRRRRA